MILSDKEKFIKLSVLGYEFAHSEDEYDANWLLVEVQAKYRNRDWTLRDPCLLADELVELINWLEHLSEKTNGVTSIEFMENELSFEFNPESMEFIIGLDWGLHPDGEHPDYRSSKKIFMPFVVSAKQIQSIIKPLKGYAKKFPVRVKGA